MVRILFYASLLFLLCNSCTSDNKASSGSSQTSEELGDAFTSTIPPAEFLEKYRAQVGAIMIDVRTPKEFVQGKIVPEAVNVDYHSDKFLEKILEHDRSEPIYVYCFSGGRSSKAAYKMRQLGFDRIYECAGGYQRWQKEVKK